MICDGQDPIVIAAAVRALLAGELVGVPTETVYGLAANAEDDRAVAKVFALKGRPAAHPLIVHLAQAGDVGHFAAAVPAFAQSLSARFWPGPLTLILPRRPAVAAAAAGAQNSIGLRCPSHPVAQTLLQACREAGLMGLAAPSANQFGRLSPTSAAHVESEFGPDLLVLDGGACDFGIESSIVDCTRGAPVLLRPGAISTEQIEQACGMALAASADIGAAAPRAPGTLEVHYAPRAKLRLMDAQSLQRALDLLGNDIDASDAPRIAVYARAVLASRSSTLIRRRMPHDAVETARQLFAVLRSLDDQNVKLIWVETPPDTPDWDAVRDRLQRAAAV